MTKKPRENRVPIMMSEEELVAIDDWRFANRVATRSDAVRRLVRIALVVEGSRDAFLDSLQTKHQADSEIFEAVMNHVWDQISDNAMTRSDRSLLDQASKFPKSMERYAATVGTMFEDINQYRDAQKEFDAILDSAREAERRLQKITATVSSEEDGGDE